MARSKIFDFACIIYSVIFDSEISMVLTNENNLLHSSIILSCSLVGGTGIKISRIASIDILSCAVAFLCFVSYLFPSELIKNDLIYSSCIYVEESVLKISILPTFDPRWYLPCLS